MNNEIIAAAKNLCDAIAEMPTGYMSMSLSYSTAAVNYSIKNGMLIALNHRCRNLIEEISHYPDYRTEEVIAAAEELQQYLPPLTNAVMAPRPQ